MSQTAVSKMCTRAARGLSRRVMIRGAAAAVLALAAVAGSAPSHAQDFPTKPVRVIVPFGAGGLADVTMRIAGEKLGEILGQQLVIENHPGAGGVAAANELLKADADGHTLIVMSNGTTIAVSLFKDLSYNPQEDFAPISTVAWFDLALFVNPQAGYDDLQALVAKAKAEPGLLNVGTVSPGSSQNLAAEYFRSAAGIDVNIVPYKTSPEILAALIRGDLDLAVESPTAFAGAISGNQAKVLAVTGAKRNPSLPDVPTVEEAGVEGFIVEGWNALYTKAGTPDDVVAKLHDAIEQVVSMPEIQQKFAELGTLAQSLTPEQMAERFEADRAKWAEVIESAGIETR